jgi:uncharacterized membrane protein
MSVIVERLTQQRRTILIGSLIGFALWRGAHLAQLLRPADGPPVIVFVAVELAGWLIWAAFLLRVILFDRRVPVAVRGALNDELTTHRRGTSFTVGLVAVIAAQGILLLLAVLNPGVATNGIALAVEFTILVGVIATLGSYLYLDRE